jgi:MFS family permease
LVYNQAVTNPFQGLDTTIAADVQTAVYERFNNIEDIAWLGLGFPMGSVAGILFIGRLYELYNIKWLMNASIFTFEVGSALCGAAPSMNALIVGRVIAGLGGSGMYIGALNFVSALGSQQKLLLYNALIGACWGTGAILGPVVGGAFATSSATWRWVSGSQQTFSQN